MDDINNTEREGKKRTPELDDLLKRVEAEASEVAKMEEACRKRKRVLGVPVNWVSGYKDGKRASKKAKVVEELQTQARSIVVTRSTTGRRFCNVKTSRTPPLPDPNEPSNVAEAIASWGLDYVVITSVDRDDLPDQGSGHFAETVRKLKSLKPNMLIEALVPDFRGNSGCVETVAKSGLDVFAHNIETVEELQSVVRDHRANFKQSIDVLKMAKEYAPAGTLTKTSIMLGCGETPDQVISTMEKVRAAGVDVMTFGQYMRPSKRHMPVSEYVTPGAFDKYRSLGMEMGFRYVASGPMVRSSYKAGEFYIKSMIDADRAKARTTPLAGS